MRVSALDLFLVLIAVSASASGANGEDVKIVKPEDLKQPELNAVKGVSPTSSAVSKTVTITIPAVAAPHNNASAPDDRCAKLTPDQRAQTPGC